MAVYGAIKSVFIDSGNNNTKVTEPLGYINVNLLSNDGEQIKRDVETIANFVKGVRNLTTMGYHDSYIEYSLSFSNLAYENGVEMYG